MEQYHEIYQSQFLHFAYNAKCNSDIIILWKLMSEKIMENQHKGWRWNALKHSI